MCDSLLHNSLPFPPFKYLFREGGGGGRLEVNRWIGTHFHEYIDFYGVAFSAIFNRVTRMGLHIFEILGVRKLWQVRIHKQEDS